MIVTLFPTSSKLHGYYALVAYKVTSYVRLLRGETMCFPSMC